MGPRIKICVIGLGSAAAIFISNALQRVKFGSPIDIQCIHNPNISILTVGEACSGAVSRSLSETFDIEIDSPDILKDIDGRIRFGADHTWEDDLGNNFRIDYNNDVRPFALHFNSEKFSRWVVKLSNEKYPNNFKEIHENVLDIRQNLNCATVISENGSYEYDYVVDCRGTPTKEEFESGNYEYPNFETVNSAIIYPEFKAYDEDYSQVVFHKNGWMFGIPLQHRKAFGYLYNSSITTKEDALEHFKTIKPELELEKLRYLNWKHYYRKRAMDGRILYLGNRLYFFEPIMALPLHYYNYLSYRFFNYLCDYFTSYYDMETCINHAHTSNIARLQDLIVLNYAGENDMRSDFWIYAKEKASVRLRNSPRFEEWANLLICHDFIKPYWPHPWDLMRDYVNGANVKLEKIMR